MNRKQYSMKQKMLVIELYNKGDSVAEITKNLKINSSTIHRILKKKEYLAELSSKMSKSVQKKRKRVRFGVEEIDLELIKYVNNENENGVPISKALLHDKV